MRKTFLIALSGVLALSAGSNICKAQGTLIYYWNFNNFNNVVHWPAIASLGADYGLPGHDTAKARVVYTAQYPGVSSGYATYADFVSGDVSDTVNARMGAASGNGFRTRNPSDSMELLIYVPSTHFTNLTLKYACEASSFTSGMLQQVYSYSIDSGTTWTTSGAGLSTWSDTTTLTYTLHTIHFNDAAATNNSKLVFRVTFNFNTTGTSGNNRFDNITLEGDSTSAHTGVSDLTAAEPSYSLYPNPVASNFEINCSCDGPKTVQIVNLAGQTVYDGQKDGTNVSVNASAFASGMYFVTIRESNTGTVTKMKFIKQ